MLKKEVTYTTFDGEEVTDTLYFNLSKTEIVELQVSYPGGFQSVIEKIVATNDNHLLVQEFKKIILMTYGIKSDDNKLFMKSDQIRDEFVNSAAYDALFMEFITDQDSLVNFINGVIPPELNQPQDQDKPAPGTGISVVNLPPPPNV